jgi:DNA repair exonuclease SbcCD nuclease subunit
VNSRLQDSLNILNEIYNACIADKVDGVLCLGDLFHARSVINVSAFNKVYEAVAKIKTAVDFVGLLVGNHDQVNKTGTEHSIQTFNSIVTVMDKPMWYVFEANEEQIAVLAIPFSEDKDALHRVIGEKSTEATANNIMLGHFGISGATPGANFVMINEHDLTLPDLRFKEFDQVFLGHYHLPQVLTSNVRFVGATHQHNWGDVDQDRGYWLYDTHSDRLKEPHQILLNSAPKFVKYPYDTIINPKFSEEHNIEGNFVRIICPPHLKPDQWAEAAALVKDWGARKVEPWIVDTGAKQVISGSKFQAGMDFETMIESYVEELSPESDHDTLVNLGKDILKAATN